MKKSILAVAVAAALPAAAFAQSNVTMYGIGDASIEFSTKGANANNKSDIKMQDGIQSSSRWGVQGVEDLGGGLAATFVLEAGIDVDDGDGEGIFIGRQARIGLKGAFGELRLGRQYDPLFYAALNNDFSGYGWYNNHYAIAGSAGRWSNELEYRNTFGGFQIVAGVSLGETGSTGTAPAVTVSNPDENFGIAAIYQSANWGLNAGFQTQGGGDTTVGGTTTSADAAQIFQVGGNVGFGPARLGLSYGVSDQAGTKDRTDIYASLGFKVGASGEIVANVKMVEDSVDVRAGQTDGTYVGLAYGHAISKRTNWYVALGLDQPDGAADDPMKVALGIRHKF